MSILIKGMKMPKEKPLRIVLNPNGQLFVDHGICFTEYEAVEVPTPHGRLIAAGKLERDIEQYHLSDGKFQHWVQVQNTIIEAEEESKE